MTTTKAPGAAGGTADQSRTGSGGASPVPAPSASAETGSFRVPADRGRTSIATSVVEKIAGLAAREVPGVHDFGGSLARSIGAVRDRVPGGRPNVTRGVKVEVGEKQSAVDLDLVVEYGVAITDVVADVRENVINAVERMTGLEVVEVNVAVVDVHLLDDDEVAVEGRVQ